MLDAVLLIFFGVMAVRVATAVSREATVFREFQQSRSLAFLALLFPLGPLVMLAGLNRIGLLGSVLVAAACYLPALLSARRLMRAFDQAGTDRVSKAQSAASQAFGTALVGLLYVAVVFTLGFFSNRIGAAGA